MCEAAGRATLTLFLGHNQYQQRPDFHEEADAPADKRDQQDGAPADVQLQTVTVSRKRILGVTVL